MAKVKLDLDSKNDELLGTFADNHKTAISGNVNFPTPVPTPLLFDAALTSYFGKLAAIAQAETALQTLRSQKDDLRVDLEANLTARGAYVELTSGGDEAKILSVAFQVQAAAAPTTSMPAPTGMTATMGDNDGEVDLSCDAVPKAKSYISEMRDHSDTAAPGPWVPAKVSSGSSATVTGLVSGKKYAFRMRALGPNDLESPWSGEVICMAP